MTKFRSAPETNIDLVAQSDAGRFVEVFQSCLQEHARRDAAVRPFVNALGDFTPAQTDRELPAINHPLHGQLGGALSASVGNQDLIAAVSNLAADKGWYQVYTGGGINASMSDFMLAKQVIGPKGPLDGGPVRSGVFLLAPGFNYLMHDHAASEIYYVLSGTVDIQNGLDSAPQKLIPGQYSVTPSGVPHALQTGDSPVILLYVWTGEVTAPIWWWVKSNDGAWTKVLAKNP